MTYKEIYDALVTAGYPITYEHFESPENIPALPYIVFTYPRNNDMHADNQNYVEIVVLQVGLYTKRKNLTAEHTVEAVLRKYFNPYTKSSEYVSADSVQETIYTMEVVINA